jgi:hypothetical protein
MEFSMRPPANRQLRQTGRVIVSARRISYLMAFKGLRTLKDVRQITLADRALNN